MLIKKAEKVLLGISVENNQKLPTNNMKKITKINIYNNT